MKKTSSRREGQMFFAMGLILICVAIICNEWILAKAFSKDGILKVYTKVKIWIFDIILILIGSALIKYRKSKEIILQFSQSHPRMLDSLIGVILTVIMLLCAEWGVFYTLNYYKKKNIETTWTEKLTQDDELLGYKAKPDIQVSAIKKLNGKIVYDVTYSIDEYSRRITPVKNPTLTSLIKSYLKSLIKSYHLQLDRTGFVSHSTDSCSSKTGGRVTWHEPRRYKIGSSFGNWPKLGTPIPGLPML